MVVESGYKFQGKATTEFGIEFRSKLESQWAYYFQSRGLDWNYADHAWYDFVVNGIKIEVKPYAEGMLFRAAERVPKDEILVVVFGHPPKKNWSERFSKSVNFEQVNALSVFNRREFQTTTHFHFRDASVGLYVEDEFFSGGIETNRVDGCISITKDEVYQSAVSINNGNAAVCRTLSGLISDETRDTLKRILISNAKRLCDKLDGKAFS